MEIGGKAVVSGFFVAEMKESVRVTLGQMNLLMSFSEEGGEPVVDSSPDGRGLVFKNMTSSLGHMGVMNLGPSATQASRFRWHCTAMSANEPNDGYWMLSYTYG